MSHGSSYSTPVDSPSPAPSSIDPVITQVFEKRFPGVVITRAFINEWKRSHTLIFESEIETLLRFRLVDTGMVPAKPKRKAWPVGKRANEGWETSRRAGDRLSVRLEVSDSTPADHPLAILAPKHRPFLEDGTDARATFEHLVRTGGQGMFELIRAMTETSLRFNRYGYRIAESTRQRILSALDNFERDHRAALLGLRMERDGMLRLVRAEPATLQVPRRDRRA